MSKVVSLRERFQSKVPLQAIGNSKRTMRDVAIDLIHASGQHWSVFAAGCFLSPATIKNLATGKTIHPRYDTIERIFRYCEMSMTLEYEALNSKFRNVPKVRRSRA